jgi:hypothetical protein
MAEAAPQREGRYLAFNKLIAAAAKTSMPKNVLASTLHSLAFGPVGKHYAHRLDSSRMRSDQIARILRIDPIFLDFGTERKVLQPGFLAGKVMQAVANFCSSADAVPSGEHVPYIDGIDVPDANGRRSWANNAEVRRTLAPFILAAWRDLSDPRGQLRFSHDVYKKLYCLDSPQIAADFVMVDEAQDLTPCDEKLIADQRSAQVVLVGDPNQAIYAWKGCRDSLASTTIPTRTALTMSFRFGAAIADVANGLLTRLEAEHRVVGAPWVDSVVGPCSRPRAILCRTNAEAVTQVLNAQAAGRRPALVGGARDVSGFAKAAKELLLFGRTDHRELCPFTSWEQVRQYVANDALGSELKLMVRLVDDFGADAILRALDQMPTPERADLVVGTAHAVKGLEWDTVSLAGDFFEEPDTAELRLMYVAVTRARNVLDVSACGALAQPKPNTQPSKEAAA